MQPTETESNASAGVPGDSQPDSADESSPEDHTAPVCWDDLPIMERLGLTSGVDMTEEEVESAFTQLALAFSCDQYTLSQRHQAEEHERSVAHNNLTLELQNSRDTLQTLKGRCVDSDCSDILDQMEARLNTVLPGMDEIISAAETLGAVHQEARVSCSVELMQIHIEQLKRHHVAESAELVAKRKLFHRSRGRIHSDSEDIDVRNLFVRQGSQQHLTRRRVSITLMPTTQSQQPSDVEAMFQEDYQTNNDSDSQGPEEGAVTQEISSPQTGLRHRCRSAILEQEGCTEQAEGRGPSWSEMTARPREQSTADCHISDPSAVISEQRPLSSWLPCLGGALVLAIFLLCFLLLPGFVLTGTKSPGHYWTPGTTAT